MRHDDINAAIAEACGWDEVSDFCSDLNAMHQAEQVLWSRDWTARGRFIDALARILSPVHGYFNQSALDLLDANARQRAEAFLRTVGKWEEEAA